MDNQPLKSKINMTKTREIGAIAMAIGGVIFLTYGSFLAFLVALLCAGFMSPKIVDKLNVWAEKKGNPTISKINAVTSSMFFYCCAIMFAEQAHWSLKEVKALDLREYAELSGSVRKTVQEKIFKTIAIPEKSHQDFTNCIGDYAYTKNPELMLVKIVRWCDGQYLDQVDDPTNKKFSDHFNELHAADQGLDRVAYIKCESAIKRQLKSPSTADFPFFAGTTRSLHKGKYFINSHVDAQNSYGATIRQKWNCTIQYSGNKIDGDEEFYDDNWVIYSANIVD